MPPSYIYEYIFSYSCKSNSPRFQKLDYSFPKPSAEMLSSGTDQEIMWWLGSVLLVCFCQGW